MLILLLLSLAAADTPTAAKLAANNPDKVICRQFPVTGSLVQTYKTCKTRREWDQERDALRSGPASASCRAAAEGGFC